MLFHIQDKGKNKDIYKKSEENRKRDIVVFLSYL